MKDADRYPLKAIFSILYKNRSVVRHTTGLHFPASLAFGCGHMTRCSPVASSASSGSPKRVGSASSMFSSLFHFLDMEDNESRVQWKHLIERNWVLPSGELSCQLEHQPTTIKGTRDKFPLCEGLENVRPVCYSSPARAISQCSERDRARI